MPGFGTSVPTTYLRARVTTHDGVELTFGNSVAPLAPLGLVAIAAFSYLNHSAVPWLFTPILLLFFLRDVWTFCYAGPRVRHELHLFGVNVWRSEWRLDKADSASADLIEDSLFKMQRPRWYKLNLWSCVRQKDHTLMRSNNLEELDRLVTVLNDTIKEVSANAAS